MARMSSRGQTLLVGAIALAVLFVSLALVLNTAIYGSTIASEGSEDVTGGQTIALQSAVERDVGFLIERGVEEHPSSVTNQQTFVDEKVTQLNDRYSRYYAENDRIVSLSLASAPTTDFVTGQEVSNGGGSFDVGSDQITDDSYVRDFTIDVSSQTADFEMRFENTTGTEYVVRILSSGGIEVDEVGGPTVSCSASSNPTIDMSASTVNGNRCNALDFFERSDGPYSLHFQNPTDVSGNFALTTNDTASGLNVGATQSRLYAVNVDLSERSTRVDYENTIRVAPRELQ